MFWRYIGRGVRVREIGPKRFVKGDLGANCTANRAALFNCNHHFGPYGMAT